MARLGMNYTTFRALSYRAVGCFAGVGWRDKCRSASADRGNERTKFSWLSLVTSGRG